MIRMLLQVLLSGCAVVPTATVGIHESGHNPPCQGLQLVKKSVGQFAGQAREISISALQLRVILRRGRGGFFALSIMIPPNLTGRKAS